MSSPGRSSPGTPGVFSSTANDFRIEYSSLRITTNTIGSRCWAAVQIACTEYWNDPSPMVASTVRLTPRARSPSATPTAAGTPQPIPPLAVAKNEAGRVVGRNRSLLGHRRCRFGHQRRIGGFDGAQGRPHRIRRRAVPSRSGQRRRWTPARPGLAGRCDRRPCPPAAPGPAVRPRARCHRPAPHRPVADRR